MNSYTKAAIDDAEKSFIVLLGGGVVQVDSMIGWGARELKGYEGSYQPNGKLLCL